VPAYQRRLFVGLRGSTQEVAFVALLRPNSPHIDSAFPITPLEPAHGKRKATMENPSTGKVCPEPDTGTEGAGLPTLKERQAQSASQRASRRTTRSITLNLDSTTARHLSALCRIERRTPENEALYLLEHAITQAYFKPQLAGGVR
jgi:hypothetical protein